MNKTVNINLGGIFFHIDEDAYTKLKKYLEAIRRSLSDDPQGKDEILHDIEARIGELLDEQKKNDRQVINMAAIEQVINIMGKPEDYAGDEALFDEELKTKRSKQKTHYTKTRKLFRDTEDKFLGGVSSGLAHYFDIDVTIIRLLWFISVFVFGTGVLAYLILWIILPEARTTAEKLQMQGDPVTVSNIEKKIKEELSDVSDRIKSEYDNLKKKDYSDIKSGLQEVVDFIIKLINILFQLVGKTVGALLIIIAFITLVSLLIGGFSLGSLEVLNFSGNIIYPPFFYNSILPMWLLSVLLFVAIAIPFIFLFALGLRILSKENSKLSRTTKSGLLGIWLIAILGITFSAIELGVNSQSKSNIVSVKKPLNIKANDTLTIQMHSKDELTYTRKYGRKIILENDVERLYNNNITIDVREAKDTTSAYLRITKRASGKNLKNAKKNAETITYHYAIKDNKIVLDNYLTTAFKQRYYKQRIDIIVYVPQGTTVFFDSSTADYLDDVRNIQQLYDPDMVNHYFKMTRQGFDCTDCKKDIDNEDAEWETEKKDEKGSFKVKIDHNGLDIKVKSDSKDSTAITFDKNGLRIK